MIPENGRANHEKYMPLQWCQKFPLEYYLAMSAKNNFKTLTGEKQEKALT